MITGFQYGTNNLYIGKYQFPNNLDSEVVHLPPNTTLLPPPENVALDLEVFWNGSKWNTRRITMNWLDTREIPNGT